MPSKKSDKSEPVVPEPAPADDAGVEVPEDDDADHLPEHADPAYRSAESEEGEKIVEEERKRSFGMDYTSDEFKEHNPVAAAETPGHKGGPSSTDFENEQASEYNEEVEIPEDLQDDESKATDKKGGEGKFEGGEDSTYSPTT